MKKAIITGITGQDGSYLAEFLLQKGYEVHGLIRRTSASNTQRLDHLINNQDIYDKTFFLHQSDLGDAGNLNRLIKGIEPDEFYHLGAQSHVRISFDIPEYTVDVDALGTVRLMEAIRNYGKPVKFYMASSSEMFGATHPPQNEESKFHPRSPYACSKVFSYHFTRHYREAYGMFNCNGILFNHESPRRGDNFVTRKIALAVAKIKLGKQNKLKLGNLDAKRDWGYAPEYVEAMWMMMQKDKPDDFVIATGESHSVKEFVEEAFKYAELGDWQKYVEIDPALFRPTEVDNLIGDASKAEKELGWKPKVAFKDLVKIMVDAELGKLQTHDG